MDAIIIGDQDSHVSDYGERTTEGERQPPTKGITQ
jgi:hypothetical protein